MNARSLLLRRVQFELPASLQVALLLSLLSDLPNTVGSRVSRSQAQMRWAILSGQQRLRDLLANIPPLRLIAQADDAKNAPDEAVARAILGFYLALMLHQMARHVRCRVSSSLPLERQPCPPRSSSQPRHCRPRLCFLSPL